MVFLQMPLFSLQELELQTQKDKWLYFLKNLESFDEIPAILREPVFEKAFGTAKYLQMSPQMQEAYFASRKAYLDNVNTFNYALEQAKLKGRTEGEAKGLAEKAVEVAQNMKQEGLPIALISKMTGLSVAEIERLD